MRDYRSIRYAAAGDYIGSVSGSSGDYDLTLDDGTVIEAYDETAGTFDTTAPVAGDLAVFGILTGDRRVVVANVEVIKAAVAALFIIPVDATL